MSLEPRYRPLLALRPTNAMHFLSPRGEVPLLSSRELAPALRELGLPLWLAAVEGAGQVEAVLRAAAQARACAGLVLWPDSLDEIELRRRWAPAAFFNQARQAAEQQARVCPFTLHLQQPPWQPGDGRGLELLRAYLVRAAESGFVSFSLDLHPAGGDDQALELLLADLAGFAPGLLLRCILEGPVDETALAGYLERCLARARQAGLEPQALLLDGAGATEVFAGLCERLPAPEARLLGLGQEQPGKLAGVLEPAAVLARLAGGSGTERNEALVYMEAGDWLESLGLEGSAPRLAQRLLAAP